MGMHGAQMPMCFSVTGNSLVMGTPVCCKIVILIRVISGPYPALDTGGFFFAKMKWVWPTYNKYKFMCIDDFKRGVR